MNKTERQKLLKELIIDHEFDTQNDLVDYLNERGLLVTQATISRDIKELGIIKIKGQNKYKYSFIDDSLNQNNLYNGTVLDINFAQNIVVVKTSVGAANSICIIIDNRLIDGVLGSVAGDDTIIIVTQNQEKAQCVVEELKRIFK